MSKPATKDHSARMTVAEFTTWAMTQPGRYELYDGVPVAMSPERSRHADVKFNVAVSLKAAIEHARLACFMKPDGMTVKVHDHLSFEPDALVYCGTRIDDDAITVPNPVIVAEVLSPGTKSTDFNRKFEGYFQIASIVHYLILDGSQNSCIHHRRGQGEIIETRIMKGGTLNLDPPGLTVDLADFFV